MDSHFVVGEFVLCEACTEWDENYRRGTYMIVNERCFAALKFFKAD